MPRTNFDILKVRVKKRYEIVLSLFFRYGFVECSISYKVRKTNNFIVFKWEFKIIYKIVVILEFRPIKLLTFLHSLF